MSSDIKDHHNMKVIGSLDHIIRYIDIAYKEIS